MEHIPSVFFRKSTENGLEASWSFWEQLERFGEGPEASGEAWESLKHWWGALTLRCLYSDVWKVILFTWMGPLVRTYNLHALRWGSMEPGRSPRLSHCPKPWESLENWKNLRFPNFFQFFLMISNFSYGFSNFPMILMVWGRALCQVMGQGSGGLPQVQNFENH